MGIFRVEGFQHSGDSAVVYRVVNTVSGRAEEAHSLALSAFQAEERLNARRKNVRTMGSLDLEFGPELADRMRVLVREAAERKAQAETFHEVRSNAVAAWEIDNNG